MAVRTQLKAGGGALPNHNETVVVPRPVGMLVKTQLKAGGISLSNHNETVVVARPRRAA